MKPLRAKHGETLRSYVDRLEQVGLEAAISSVNQDWDTHVNGAHVYLTINARIHIQDEQDDTTDDYDRAMGVI